ncbi:MAG: petC [Bacillales bacterium]|jgi:glycine/D-amino acid oxidase-like deaminating enzyme/nitrite reductase/ring-hydroxylating ferredoxin subunit|nr:petC [Bacillales bacterium]
MTISLPQFPESYWHSSTRLPSFPSLSFDVETEVCIVGGGITGISTAYLLAQKGIKTVLIEADTLFKGATGFTTAKITAQHGLIYDEFIHFFGIESAKCYYDTQTEALNFIRQIVGEKNIDCGFTNEDAFMYTNSDAQLIALQNEFKAYQALGIAGDYLEKTDLPFQVKAAIKMSNQAQFHPLQYLVRLTQDFLDMGGEIYEKTIAIDLDTDKHPTVITKEGPKISCNHVAICSHFPFVDKLGFYFARMHAEKSYVLGVKTNLTYPGGMYKSAEEPARSIRKTSFNGDDLLLIGGETHIVGRGESTIGHYEALMDFAEENFESTEIKYRWSTHDLVTLDKLPFVGPIGIGNSNILVATGYRKWGMTNGTAAAHLLRDYIVGKESSYGELVSPARFNSNPSFKNLAMNFKDMATEMLNGKLEMVLRDPEDLANDEGDVVKVNGKRAGAYRDTDGKLHIVDTTCTHMGCELKWNSGDRSWDCPCHGSRFNTDGEVLSGPAKKDLKKL